MTAETGAAGAASHEPVSWHAIDWQSVHQNVRRLQARIVKATQQGRWGKVQALQRLLTHSFSGKALAVRRVTENIGKKTPGVDGQTWNTPEKKAAALHTLRQQGYRPRPLRRVYIPKSNGQPRPLGIPTMKDRAMQALYLLALDPIAETSADPNSYGFRCERSCADAIEQCFIVLSKKTSAPWVLEGDITSCFDRISHQWLLAHVPMDRSILRKWLKAGFMHRHVLYPTRDGVPQGGIISPVLANLALDGLERVLREAFATPRTRASANKVHLVRYADDFVITGGTQEVLREQVQPLVEQFLRERGLELSQEKTRITPIEDGFDFLGQNLRKYAGKLLIKPSKRSVSAFLEKARGVIKENRQASAGALIRQLNPLIRGWANYHRHVVSKATFVCIDHALFQALWRWAKRRHPNKSRPWVYRRYFRAVGNRGGIFFGEVIEADGAAREVRLVHASATPIERHVKIQMTANPYDPAWEVYFEKRLGVTMENSLRGRRTLRYLWKEQGGLCPVCHQKITLLTGWHSHHIVQRVLGGSDGVDNRVLLHPQCHRQLHSQHLSVAKPRLSNRGVGKA